MRLPGFGAACLVVFVTVAAMAEVPDAARLPRGSNDPGFADSESGCAEARIRDYLRRHGIDGYIDPDASLEMTREVDVELRAERNLPDSIGGTVWKSLGPTNGAGRMTAIAPHPTVAGTVWAGAAGGGVWKSANYGATWTPLTETLANLSIGAVAVAKSNPSIVYAGTGEGGIAVDFIPGIGLLASSDGGATWNLPSSVISTTFYRLAVHPTNAQEIVAGTGVGALRSTGGQNGPWTTVIPASSTPASMAYGHVTDIVRDPANAQVLYAATWDIRSWCARFTCFDPNRRHSPTILKSTDGGATWSPANSGLPVSTSNVRVDRWSLAIAPSSPQILYAATATYDATTGAYRSHVYKTTNGGGTWTETSLSSEPAVRDYLRTQAWYDNVLVVAPNDPNIVIAGGVSYAMSTDGGTTWSRPAFSGTSVHVDAHDLQYDSSGTLYIANDGGVWTTTDHGATATARNAGLVTRQFYAMVNDPVNRKRMFGGQQDNGTIRRADSDSTAWDFALGGDGFECAVLPAVPEITWATIQFNNIYRAVNAGDPDFIEYLNINPPYEDETGHFFTQLHQDPVNPATLYTATDRVWKSTTGGDAWAPLPTTTTDGSQFIDRVSIVSIAVARTNPQILMASQQRWLFRSTNGGMTWANVFSNLPNRSVNDVAIHPANPNIVYVALAGMSAQPVYYSTNGGTSWTARGTGLPSFSAHVLTFDPTDPETIYCGTDVGVYRSTDGGASWSRFGTAMPAVSVYDVQALQDGTVLRAATHGRGIWELEVTGATNQPPVAALTSHTAPLTVTEGALVTFAGTFSDPNAGDGVTGLWTFPHTWETKPATSGLTVKHRFHRAGRFPISLSAADSAGGRGAAQVMVDVMDEGDSCATPHVVPGAGPFPYSITVNPRMATSDATDPVSVACFPYNVWNGVWLSFTPSVSGTYDFSLCGSRTAALLAGYTGNSCGPYTAAGLCLAASPQGDCATSTVSSVSLNAGTTIRILVASQSVPAAEATVTITRNTDFTPAAQLVSPGAGPAAGGTEVVITGSGFADGVSVTFGGVAAPSVRKATPRLIVATTPPHAPGVVDVVVQNPGDPGAATLGGAFVYVSAPLPAPASFVATATSTTTVSTSWSAVAGASGYELYRSASGQPFALVATPAAPPFVDNGRSPGVSYLYRVRAVTPDDVSPLSNADVATTIFFTDDPLSAGTRIKAVHLTEARGAVNALRALASLPAMTYTDPSPAGLAVKALHMTELRNALSAARTALGLPAVTFAHPLTPGTTPVRAGDMVEIRDGVR